MTIVGKLFRTTAFKLSLAYLVIFAIGAGVVLGGIDWDVNQLLDGQIGQTIQAETSGLSEQYDTGGNPPADRRRGAPHRAARILALPRDQLRGRAVGRQCGGPCRRA